MHIQQIKRKGLPIFVDETCLTTGAGCFAQLSIEDNRFIFSISSFWNKKLKETSYILSRFLTGRGVRMAIFVLFTLTNNMLHKFHFCYDSVLTIFFMFCDVGSPLSAVACLFRSSFGVV